MSGVHGGNLEECRLLAYINQFSTSQEAHYISVTDPRWLMLLKFEVFTAVTIKNVHYY
jgi:hypothetical protein